MNCRQCENRLGRGNKSGLCKPCFSVQPKPEGFGARVSAGLKRKLAADPVFKEKLRAIALANTRSEKAFSIRQERFKREQMWLRGNRASLTPEAMERRARAASATKLAWCPPELRDEYRRLIYSKRLPSAEAREIVLAQHERDMANFRRSIGA